MDHFSIGHGEDAVDIDKVDVDEQAALLAALELNIQARNEEGNRNVQPPPQPIVANPPLQPADFSLSRQRLGAVLQDPFLPPAELEYGYLAEACVKFHNDRLLGEGAFGKVYRGVDQALGTRFAVKVLSDAEQVGQFEKELKVLSGLQHSNIIRLLGYSRGPRGHLLVYALAPYGSLDAVLKGDEEAKRLSWASRVAVALGVARALAHLHKNNNQTIFHRDIKAANIVLGVGKAPMLIDCGLSTIVNLDKHNGMTAVTVTGVNGTGAYMDPSFVRTGKYSAASDVYSFGVVLLELLTGKVATSEDILTPFEDDDVAVADGRCGACPDEIDKELRALAQECIRKPAQRPNMLVIMRRLQALDITHAASRMPELLKEAQALAQAAEAALARGDVAKKTCVSCMDDCAEGVACSTGEHFLCSPCLADYIRTQAEGEDVSDRMRGEDLLCIVPNCQSDPLEDHLIMEVISKQKNFTKCFLRLKKKAIETAAFSEVERRVAREKAELARLLKDDVPEYHRRHIQEDILTLRCPRCKQAFNDFNGCLDLECSRQGCKIHFCGLCLADCGDDAHAHVANCAANPNQDKSVFVSAEVYARVQKERRQKMLTDYLNNTIVDKAIRAEVIRRAGKDFQDLGLKV